MTDDLGQAGRTDRPKRNRAMTPADRRRVILVDGIHDTGNYQPPLPPVDDKGNPLPVVTEEGEHRTVLHLDGKAEDRPPAEWEDLESEFRNAVFVNAREELTEEHRKVRASRPLWRRLRDVQQAVHGLGQPRALRVRETDARSAQARDNTPEGEGEGAIGYARADELSRRLMQILGHVEAIEAMLDEHHGHAHRSLALMSREEKVALVTGRKYRGLHVRELHALHPELGSVRTLRIDRAEAGQDAYGRKLPDKEEPT